MRLKRTSYLWSLVVALLAMASTSVQAQKNVLQPGDPIIASSANSPGSEGVANVIDGKQTKYLNFDSDADAAAGFKPSGFVVSPSIGVTRVIGMSILSANDAADRDPKTVTLEGSNDDKVASYSTGTWEMITTLEFPAFAARFQTQTLFFDNFKAYKHYRWVVTATQGPSTCCLQVAEVGLLGGLLPQDVTQPGDPIIASSANSPGSEGVANVIDGKQTKYLNFDSDADAAAGFKPSGFVVSPSLGKTVVTGMTILSANDAADRDAKTVTLEGSNDDKIASYAEGNWEMITTLNVPAFAARFQTQTFLFDNYKPFKHYRWVVTATQGPSTCCLQVAEVELLGSGAPKDVTQPGDPLIASSANSPGSEGVANIIDGKQTKYLNFDSDADAAAGFKPSGFVVTPSVGATTITGISMQSANDAADRDPKSVTIEGSNDDKITEFGTGTWEVITKLEVPAFAARFQTQEFYFANKKSYKSYRWTVTATQGPSTCCLQIAEVELLAVTEGADCNKARILVQPVETPVLSGSSATLFVTVNGPWPLQWYKNGQPIPGANQTTLTTDPVTAANATNTYSVQIVGCEMSAVVKANIFTPSTTRSIGVSFQGGGANGAPTLVNTNDIMGLQQQAYWVNAANAGTGALPDLNVDPPVLLTESDNRESTITFDWQSNGAWGSGAGNASATQRMLNGLVYANPGSPATITFGNVPNGTHSVIAYCVNIPLQFQDVDFSVTGTTTQRAYVRAMNADEYNAAPGFYRGVSTDPKVRTVASYVRFDNVQPTGGTITLTWDTMTTGFDRGAGVNGVQLILNSTPAGAPPVITADPQPAVATVGGITRLSVTATGDNLTYQWQKNGRNLPNGGNISGATSSTLTITSMSEADEAVYGVAVFNAGGSTISKNASVRISKFDITDGLAGYWKLDETSGTTAANAVAGGRPGTVIGTSAWAAGRIASSLRLDGASTYVMVDDYTKGVKGISGSGWVRVDAGTATDVVFFRNGEGTFRRSGDGNPAKVGQFEIGLMADATDGSLRLSASIQVGPNLPRATAGTPFPLGSWQHVAFSADGAQLRVYLNGAQVAFTDYLGNINPPDVKYISMGAMLSLDPNDPAAPLAPDLTAPRFLPGQLDDVAIWTRGVTADEVSKIFAAGNSGQALTTVKVTPPVVTTQPKLGVSVAAGAVTITFDGGKLQSATSPLGPWADVAGAATPFSESLSGQAKFYRAIVP